MAVLPLLAADMGGERHTFLELVEAAVRIADLQHMPVRQVRELIHVYRGLDIPVLGALAQLRLLCGEAWLVAL